MRRHATFIATGTLLSMLAACPDQPTNLYAIETAEVVAVSSAWTDIPGLTLSFNSIAGQIDAFGVGTVWVDSNTYCFFRFLVDGAPSADSPMADASVYGGASNTATSTVMDISVLRRFPIMAGEHVVTLQIVSNGGGGCGTDPINPASVLLTVP